MQESLLDAHEAVGGLRCLASVRKCTVRKRQLPATVNSTNTRWRQKLMYFLVRLLPTTYTVRYVLFLDSTPTACWVRSTAASVLHRHLSWFAYSHPPTQQVRGGGTSRSAQRSVGLAEESTLKGEASLQLLTELVNIQRVRRTTYVLLGLRLLTQSPWSGSRMSHAAPENTLTSLPTLLVQFTTRFVCSRNEPFTKQPSSWKFKTTCAR